MQGKLLFTLTAFSLALGACQSMKGRSEAAKAKAPAAVVAPEEKAVVLTPPEKALPPTSADKNAALDANASTAAAEDLKIKLVHNRAKAVKGSAAHEAAAEKVPSEIAAPLPTPGSPGSASEATAETASEGLGTRKVGAVSADKAYGWLRHGNTRYAKGHFRRDGASKKDRARLLKGQTPHAAVLSCSDSRVPPEVVLDQKLGEIYVVRVSGKVLNSNTTAALEYAVQYLGTNLVVLLGHENCDASEVDVRATLLEKSQILRDALASGGVRVVSAFYDLKSGLIDWKEEPKADLKAETKAEKKAEKPETTPEPKPGSKSDSESK